jgi:hypothetical protein
MLPTRPRLACLYFAPASMAIGRSSADRNRPRPARGPPQLGVRVTLLESWPLPSAFCALTW